MGTFWSSARRADWSRFQRIFAGRPVEGAASGQHGLRVNITWAVLENIIATLISRDPSAQATALRPGDDRRARKRQMALNSRLFRTRFRRHLTQAIYDALIYGIGYLKVGLTGQAKTQFDEFLPPPTPKNLNSPVTVSEQLGGDLAGEDDATYLEYTPWIRRVSPDTVFPTPGYLKLAESPQCIQRLLRPLEAVRRTYQNTQGLGASAGNQAQQQGLLDPGEDEWATRSNQDQQMVELFEIWDREKQRLVTIAVGHDQALRDDPWPHPGLEDFPIKALILNPLPKEYYGLSYVELMEDHQYEINMTRSYMLEHVKRSVKTLITREGFFTPEQMVKFEAGLVWAICEAQGFAPDAQMEFPAGGALDPNIYSIDRTLMEGVRVITGLADFQMGSTTMTKSATESNLQGQSLGARVGFKQMYVDDFTGDVIRAFDQIWSPTVTQPEFLKLTGPQGGQWLPYTAEDARAQVDVTLETGSTRLKGEDPVRLEAQIKLLNILGPMAPMIGLDLPRLAGDILESSGIRNPERYLPMMQEQIPPEEENLLIQQGLEIKVHPMDQHQQHLAVHQQGMLTTPPERLPILMGHMQEHEGILAAQGMGGMGGGEGMPGMTGGPEEVREADHGAEGAGGSEGEQAGIPDEVGELLNQAMGSTA